VKPVPQDFQRTGGTGRFQATVSLPVARDTYFIIEAGAKLPADLNTAPPAPPIVDIVVPGVVPIAITNPIFVDADGNGTFDPPGLPVMPAARPAVERPLWARMRAGLARLAARLGGEVVAEDVPGEMTGVTRADKAAAAKRGEYFPLYQFTLPPEAVEMARAAEETRRRAVEAREHP
jgi:hypothetical protein